MAKLTKVKGTLNSKEPNPYELAYKELWDKLPPWKKQAITDDISNKVVDSRYQTEFAKEVIRKAEAQLVVDETAEEILQDSH
jgi:hypothetical protein